MDGSNVQCHTPERPFAGWLLPAFPTTELAPCAGVKAGSDKIPSTFPRKLNAGSKDDRGGLAMSEPSTVERNADVPAVGNEVPITIAVNLPARIHRDQDGAMWADIPALPG